MKDLQQRAAAHGREVRIITYLFCLCRETEAEVEREVEELMAARDEAAAALTFRHYEEDTQHLISRVVPLLEKMGVRRAVP